MNHFFKGASKISRTLFYIAFAVSTLMMSTSCSKNDPVDPVLKISTLAAGFAQPMGLEVDKSGLVWVADAGTGKHDGKVSVITPDGKKYDAIINFESVAFEGEADGPTHLLFADGLLYILGTNRKLYKANVSSFKPGDMPQLASSLGVEDIGAFVLAYDFVNKTHDSHPYNLTLGPNGDIYITDAGANAILRRAKTGVLSVLAEVPGIPNPTPVGLPTIESVPTGIIYEGQHFLVSTLTGFPFLSGKALIYKISTSGVVSVFQQGFTTLTDIAEGGSLGRLVVEHGTFGAMGFAPKTGRLLWANGTAASVLADGLNLPVGLKQAGAHTWYVTSQGDGTVLKVTY